jgi:DNA-binding MarR family transcriptional regulator
MPFSADSGDAEVEARMGRAWRALRRGPSALAIFEEVFGSPGEQDSIEPGHLDVLDLLGARGDLRMTDLATELGVDPSTVTRTLQRMEAAGLARRVPDGADGRVVKAQMTAEGIRLHAVVAAKRLAILDILFEDFGTDDRAQLVGLLERFIASIDQYAARRLDDLRAASPG